MKLIWATDIHLNFLDDNERREFYQKIVSTQCNAILLSGDIAEAPCLIEILTEMADYINKPIYFVLGNHDYYRGKINEVRAAITALSEAHEKLFWLPASGMQFLENDTILLGQDGWADGCFGDYQNSRVALNDSRMIADLFQEKILGKSQLLEKMQQLADIDAKQLQHDLEIAVGKNPKKIIILTHVPPFREACFYNGKMSDDDWLPFFSSKIMGDVLLQAASDNVAIEFSVFCGHTHGEAHYKPLNNLAINVGGAEYHQPVIQKIITVA